MNKPLLWTLRALAVTLFAGVLVWQVGRRQGNAYVKGTKAARLIEREPVPEEPAAGGQVTQEKNTMFLSGSKSYTGSTTIQSGTLVIDGEDSKDAKVITVSPTILRDEAQLTQKPNSRLGQILTTGKSAPFILPEEVASEKEKMFIPGSKAGIMPHFKEVDKYFLKEKRYAVLKYTARATKSDLTPEAKAAYVNQLLLAARALQRNGKNILALAVAEEALAADPGNFAAEILTEALRDEMAVHAPNASPPASKPDPSLINDLSPGTKSGPPLRPRDIPPKTQ